MNKYFIVFFCLLSKSSLFSQDTIFTNNHESLIVRVLEISNKTVTYKYFHNPDGIIRTLNNEQIVKIIYENGTEESRFRLKQKTEGSISSSKLFVIEGKHIALNNADVSHKTAFKLMLAKDSQINSDELNEALVNVDSKKNGQIAFNIIAPTSFFAGVYLAIQHRYNDPKEQQKARTYFISGLGACVISIVTAQVYRSIKKKYIRKAALLYNNDILNYKN